MIIYKVTNIHDGKIYIGQTVQKLTQRWSNHCHVKKNANNYFYRAIQLHGRDSFKIEKIDSATTLEGLNALEEFYIKKFDCLAPKGYNLQTGGKSKKCHADTKKKLSDHFKGKPIKNRWDKGFLGSHTAETKEKIRERLKGRPIPNRWSKGFTGNHTEETKQYFKDLYTGVPQKTKWKPIRIKETGQEFESVQHAAKALGVPRTMISTFLKNGKTYKKRGYTFEYVLK